MQHYNLATSCLLLVLCLIATVDSKPTLDWAKEDSPSDIDWAAQKQSPSAQESFHFSDTIFGRAYHGLTGRYVCFQGTCGFGWCCQDGTEYCVVTGGKSSCVSSATVTATVKATQTVHQTTTSTAPTKYVTRTVSQPSVAIVNNIAVSTATSTYVVTSSTTIPTTVGGGTTTITSFVTIAAPARRDLNKRAVTITITQYATVTGGRVTAPPYTPYSTITSTQFYPSTSYLNAQSIVTTYVTSVFVSTQYQSVAGALVTSTVLSTIVLSPPAGPSTIVSTTTAPGSIIISTTSQAPSAANSVSQSTSITAPARTTTPAVVLATTPASSSASSSSLSLNGFIGLTLLSVAIGYLRFGILI